jgi:hypothetical protein
MEGIIEIQCFVILIEKEGSCPLEARGFLDFPSSHLSFFEHDRP